MKNIFAILFLFLTVGLSAQEDATAIKTDLLRLNAKTTAEMNSMTRMEEGSMCYNEETKSNWQYIDSEWTEIAGGIFKLNGDGEYYTNNRIASNYIHIKSPDDTTGEGSFNYVSLITQEDPVSSGTYYGAIITNAMAGGVSTSNRLTSAPNSWNIIGVNNVGTHIGGSTSPSEKLEVTGNIDISGVYKINGVDVSTSWNEDTYHGILNGGTSLTSFNIDVSTSRKIDMAFTASTVTIDFTNKLQALGEPIIMRLTSQNAGGTVFTFNATISDINNNPGFSVSLAENEEITLHFVVHDSTYVWCTNYPNASDAVSGNQTLSEVLAEGNIMDGNILMDSNVTRSIGNVTNGLASIYNRSYIFVPVTSDPTYTVNLGQTFYRSDLKKISYWDGTKINRLATEDYADGLSGNSFIKKNIRIATTANITLSGLQAIDGNTTYEGERVLVKDQTDPKENGIYLASSGAWSRSPEAAISQNLARTYIYVYAGNTMYDKFFQTSFDRDDDIGVDDVIFTETPFDLSGGSGTPADGSITTAKLADNAVTLDKVSAATGTNGQIMRVVSGEPTWDDENDSTSIGETVLSASKTGVATDRIGIITNSTSSDFTYTINSGVFEVGEMLVFENFSTGDIIIAYGAGVTGDVAKTINANGSLQLWQRTLNNWVIWDGEAVLTQAEYTALDSGLKANTRYNFLFTD